MKTWMLLLALYSSPDELSGMFLAPGTYTKAECDKIKQMFDRDHTAGLGETVNDMTVVFAKSDCINAPPPEKQKK